jgi:hypothetical protein
MTTVRAQIAFPFDSTLPRDMVSINPHYDGGTDVNALMTVLVNNLKAISAVGTSPFTIKLYDAKKAPPSYPLATHVEGTGSIPLSSPGEVALCLSYYAAFNRPQFRGRLYIPFTMIGGTLAKRPSGAQMTSCAGWSTLWKSLPSPWVGAVYSKKAGSAAQITNYWVDDEWDTVRSRGLRPTTRQSYTLP